MKFIVHGDPGHAWVAAPRALLEKLGVLDKVSSYSYQRGKTVYLEEDCDAMLLIDALRARGIEPTFDERHIDTASRVRSYQHFSKTPPFTPKAGMLVKYGIPDAEWVYTLDQPAGPRKGWNVTRSDGMQFRMKASQVARSTPL